VSLSYIGEIRMFAFVRGAPDGWHLCDGTLLPISEFEALFALIGTTYGGDGENTFAVPDLRGRVPMHQGQGPGFSSYNIGQLGGAETVTLTDGHLPSHTHALPVSATAASSPNPRDAVLSANSADPVFRSTTAVAMATAAVGVAGGSQPHENCMPTLTISFAISLFGIFPPQT
jgi:microcystin-dependent protein